MSDIVRKLASVQRIAEISPIEGADLIEAYRVLGWWVVAQKSMGYKVGDLVIYFEIDSFIPHSLAPFLTKDAAFPKDFNGVKGERLKTIKLRGKISQGLLLPISMIPEGIEVVEDMDLTEILGIQKWEPPISVQMAGQVQGMFPSQYASKTDQERAQNMWGKIQEKRGDVFEWTLKLDGSSMTVFKIDGELRVASRNLEWKISEENRDNVYVKMALAIGEKIQEVDNIVIQGELMGPGIQGNREKLSSVQFFVFDVVDPTTREKLNADARMLFVAKHGLTHVPVIGTYRELPFESLQELLDFADGISSITHKIAEGVVFKSLFYPEFSFKIISNKYLLRSE